MTDHILIAPTEPLRFLPDAERDVLRRLLFQRIKGMDRASQAAWNRLWRDLFNAEPGEGFAILREEGRVGQYHKMHRAVLGRLFDSQERFSNIKALHQWLKLGACFVEWGVAPRTGLPKLEPRSTAYKKCSEDDMRQFHKDAIDYLHTPRAQRVLWPHLKAPQRAEMLESVLNPPREAAC